MINNPFKIDFDKIKMIYKFGKELNFSDIQVLIKNAKRKKFALSENILSPGQNRREIYFIQKGLVRIFDVNEKGEEITMSLFSENQPFTSLDCIMFDQPCRHYFQAIEATTTLSMDYDYLQEIISKHPKLSDSRRQILQNIIKRSLDRIESFVLYSPEQRYVKFVNEHPEIINRVPNKYIANILGITPVSLSRIRRRMAGRK